MIHRVKCHDGQLFDKSSLRVLYSQSAQDSNCRRGRLDKLKIPEVNGARAEGGESGTARYQTLAADGSTGQVLIELGLRQEPG